MMTALARVVDVQEIDTEFRVELDCQQQTSCSHCASSSNCGTGVLSKVAGNKTLKWRLITSQAVKAGQMVEIGFPEKSLLQSAALVYLFPLVMMVLGAAIGSSWLAPMLGGGEGWSITTAVLFIGIGLLIARRLARKIEGRSVDEVLILRVLGEQIL
jgi:sigma-E factor negative regulatory protein RseC